MDGWWIALTAALAIFAGWLLLKLVLLRRTLRETAEELEEKLRLDTNTQITLSTGDSAAAQTTKFACVAPGKNQTAASGCPVSVRIQASARAHHSSVPYPL